MGSHRLELVPIMNVYECNGKKYFHERKDGIYDTTRRQSSEMESSIFHRIQNKYIRQLHVH
jgi:hypothetical protein